MWAEHTLKTPPPGEDLLRHPDSGLLFDSLPLGIVFQNPQGEITTANPAAETILGLSLDQMRGLTSMDPCWHAVTADGAPFPGTEHPSMVALRTGQPISDVVMGIFNPRLERHTWIRVKALPLRAGEAEAISGVYTVFDDITAHQRAEEALRRSEEKYRSLVETISDCVWEVDPEGHFTYRSPQFKTLLGYDAADFIGRSPQDLIPAEAEAEQVSASFKAFGAARQPFAELQHQALHQDGRLLTVEASGIHVFSPAGEYLGMRGITRDITARIRHEQALRQAREAAEAANRAKSESLAFNRPRPARALFAELRAGLVGRCGAAPVGEMATHLDALNFSAAPSVLDTALAGTTVAPPSLTEDLIL